MTRRLIVNGDDFGCSPDVNEAIILAHRRGILTSTSLIVSGEALSGAVMLANDNPRLAVGLHVTCTNGRAVLPPPEIPHIVDAKGAFPDSPAHAGLKYFFCKKARRELAREIAAQFEAFSASGLKFSHLDSHCHMHVHPVLLALLMRLGEAYGIRRMRVPEDDFFSALPFKKSPGIAGYALIFKVLATRMKMKLKARGFIFPRKCYGNLLTGCMDREYVLAALKRVLQGVSEIYFHPAMPPNTGQFDRNRVQLLRELAILLDTEIRDEMKRLEIIPAVYSDLERFE